MSKISQMLKLIALLETNYLITKRELAERLETSVRNVKAYIEDLRNAGIEIRGISGCKGGYFLASSSHLTPPNLEPEEYSAILLAEKVLTQKSGYLMENELKTAVAKIKWAIGDTVTVITPSIPDDFIFSYGKQDNDNEIRNIYELIYDAIINRQSLEICYYSPHRDAFTRRIIHPYGIVYRDGSWYVVSFCCLRKAIRIFKLIRIHKLNIIEEKFRYPSNFDISDYMRNSFGVFQGETYKVEIQFFHPASSYVKEKVWIANQKIMELEDGSIIFKARVKGLVEIKNWVMSYGHSALVKEPHELAELVQTEAREIAELYRKRQKMGSTYD